MLENATVGASHSMVPSATESADTLPPSATLTPLPLQTAVRFLLACVEQRVATQRVDADARTNAQALASLPQAHDELGLPHRAQVAHVAQHGRLPFRDRLMHVTYAGADGRLRVGDGIYSMAARLDKQARAHVARHFAARGGGGAASLRGKRAPLTGCVQFVVAAGGESDECGADSADINGDGNGDEKDTVGSTQVQAKRGGAHGEVATSAPTRSRLLSLSPLAVVRATFEQAHWRRVSAVADARVGAGNGNSNGAPPYSNPNDHRGAAASARRQCTPPKLPLDVTVARMYGELLAHSVIEVVVTDINLEYMGDDDDNGASVNGADIICGGDGSVGDSSAMRELESHPRIRYMLQEFVANVAFGDERGAFIKYRHRAPQEAAAAAHANQDVLLLMSAATEASRARLPAASAASAAQNDTHDDARAARTFGSASLPPSAARAARMRAHAATVLGVPLGDDDASGSAHDGAPAEGGAVQVRNDDGNGDIVENDTVAAQSAAPSDGGVSARRTASTSDDAPACASESCDGPGQVAANRGADVNAAHTAHQSEVASRQQPRPAVRDNDARGPRRAWGAPPMRKVEIVYDEEEEDEDDENESDSDSDNCDSEDAFSQAVERISVGAPQKSIETSVAHATHATAVSSLNGSDGAAPGATRGDRADASRAAMCAESGSAHEPADDDAAVTAHDNAPRLAVSVLDDETRAPADDGSNTAEAEAAATTKSAPAGGGNQSGSSGDDGGAPASDIAARGAAAATQRASACAAHDVSGEGVSSAVQRCAESRRYSAHGATESDADDNVGDGNGGESAPRPVRPTRKRHFASGATARAALQLTSHYVAHVDDDLVTGGAASASILSSTRVTAPQPDAGVDGGSGDDKVDGSVDGQRDGDAVAYAVTSLDRGTRVGDDDKTDFDRDRDAEGAHTAAPVAAAGDADIDGAGGTADDARDGADDATAHGSAHAAKRRRVCLRPLASQHSPTQAAPPAAATSRLTSSSFVLREMWRLIGGKWQ